LILLAVGPLDVLDGPFRVVVRRVAVLPALDAVEGQQLPLVVGAGVAGVLRPVPDDLVIPVASEAGVRAGGAPADLGCPDAVAAAQGGPEGARFGVVGAAGVRTFHAHRLDAVRLLAGEQRGPRRHAPAAEIGPMEAHAVTGQGVDVGRLDPRPGFGIAADGL